MNACRICDCCHKYMQRMVYHRGVWPMHMYIHVYLSHAITCVHMLSSSWTLSDVELAEEVEGNNSVEIDDYARH